MAKIKTQALKPSMYRHFAVLTVAITLVLVIFSDGENRQAVAAELQAQHDAEAARIERSKPKYGTPRLVQRQRASVWRDFNEGGGGSFGDPTDYQGSRVQRSGEVQLPSPSRLGGAFTPEDYARFGISEKELAALSPEEREKLLARLRAGGMAADPKERARQIEKLLASSAQRSGAVGGLE
jgi:hypothetical protein